MSLTEDQKDALWEAARGGGVEDEMTYLLGLPEEVERLRRALRRIADVEVPEDGARFYAAGALSSP